MKTLMGSNGIPLNSLFTPTTLHGNEGIMFLVPSIEEIDGKKNYFVEPHSLIVDGAFFKYNETMDKDIEIIVGDSDKITLVMLDGSNWELDRNQIDDFNFKTVKTNRKTNKENVSNSELQKVD